MTTWDDLTARATTDEERARLEEVPGVLREHYATALGELLETDPGERPLRIAFERWASAVVRAYGGADTERAALREWLGDPSRYPGGIDELRADAWHLEALRRTRTSALEAQDEAARAHLNADAAVREADRMQRGGCIICTRKRRLSEVYLPGVANKVTVCGTCAEALPELHAEYLARPRVATRW